MAKKVSKWPMVKVCCYCGSAFLIDSSKQVNKKFCSDVCSRRYRKEYLAKFYDEHKEELKKPEKKVKPIQLSPTKSLGQVEKEAREMNMTYGRYMIYRFWTDHKWRKHYLVDGKWKVK